MFIVEAPTLRSATTSLVGRLVVDLVAVLQGEGVDVDDRRLLARELDGLLEVGDEVALAGGHQDVERVRA